MPYIKTSERSPLLTDTRTPETPGQLNFLISTLIDDYVGRKGLSYATINEVIGVLECAKLEYYSRIATPYERIKLNENDEVYHNSVRLLNEKSKDHPFYL